MGVNKTKMLLYNKGNCQQNAKATYWMRRDIYER